MERLLAAALALIFIIPIGITGQNGTSERLTNRDILEFETKPITAWIGERFVFLGQEPELRRFGYQLIFPAGRMIGSLPYDGYVGKVVSVVDCHTV